MRDETFAGRRKRNRHLVYLRQEFLTAAAHPESMMLFKRRSAPSRDEILCSACGRIAGAADRFCPNCGCCVTPEEPEKIATSAPAAAALPVPAPERKLAAAAPDPLWDRVRDLSGQTLHTLRGKPFNIVAVSGDHVTVVPQSTGKPRPIRRQEIEKGYALFSAATQKVTSSNLRECGASEVNPVYVLAILRAIGAAGQ